jgi:hypothetical protein
VLSRAPPFVPSTRPADDRSVTSNPDSHRSYTAAAAELGTELHRFARYDLRTARELAPGAFGPIGATTGFTAAVVRFADRAALSAALLSASVRP